jgi:hypothetical protein
VSTGDEPLLPYRERLTASAGYWVLCPVAGLLVALALFPVDARLAILCGVLATTGCAVGLNRAAAPVVVTDQAFEAGRARVALHHLGDVEPLDRTATRRALGPDLDARAFTCTRPWVPTSVRVRVSDARDPTPYWLVSTRRPGRLAAALREATSHGGAQAAHSEQTS